MIVITAGTSLLLVAMAVYALRYVGSVRATGSVTPVLQIPLHWVYLAAPAGFALAGIQYALAAVRNWLTGEVHLSWDVRDEDEAEAP
jgi:TRAP-type C4-dicarboxylate transport system permease small subunit